MGTANVDGIQKTVTASICNRVIIVGSFEIILF